MDIRKYFNVKKTTIQTNKQLNSQSNVIDLFGDGNKLNKISKNLDTVNLFGEENTTSNLDIKSSVIFGSKNNNCINQKDNKIISEFNSNDSIDSIDSNDSNDSNDLNNSNNSNNIFEAFTDGSTFNNGKKNKIQFGGIGIYFPSQKHLNIGECLYGKITNNIAELKAIIKAIDYFINHNDYSSEKIIKIYSDSEYTINCITKWSKTWEKNNWKKKDKKDVCNKELIIKLYNYYKKYKIKFIHVKAHTNEPSDPKLHKIWYGNKMADKLATDSSKKSQKEFYNCKGLSSKSKSLFD